MGRKNKKEKQLGKVLHKIEMENVGRIWKIILGMTPPYGQPEKQQQSACLVGQELRSTDSGP